MPLNFCFLCSAKTDNGCGVSAPMHLIIGGEKARPGEFPWLVALLAKESRVYKFICTGNLISTRHVLTGTSKYCFVLGNCTFVSSSAGHCAENRSRDSLLCGLGKHNISNWNEPGQIVRTVRTIVIHDDYKRNSADADVAVLILTGEIELRANLTPVCLWTGSNSLDDVVGKEGIVSGWGKPSNENKYSPEPKKIKVPIARQDKCYESNVQFAYIISNRTFCAGK